MCRIDFSGLASPAIEDNETQLAEIKRKLIQ